MSTKGTIAGVDNSEMFVHFYTECLDAHPEPVYIEMWAQGDETNESMTVSMPLDKALKLADDLAKWAAGMREWLAKEKL